MTKAWGRGTRSSGDEAHRCDNWKRTHEDVCGSDLDLSVEPRELEARSARGRVVLVEEATDVDLQRFRSPRLVDVDSGNTHESDLSIRAGVVDNGVRAARALASSEIRAGVAVKRNGRSCNKQLTKSESKVLLIEKEKKMQLTLDLGRCLNRCGSLAGRLREAAAELWCLRDKDEVDESGNLEAPVVARVAVGRLCLDFHPCAGVEDLSLNLMIPSFSVGMYEVVVKLTKRLSPASHDSLAPA